MFIFSADWLFESIPPLVVGRRWIDYGFNAMAVKNHYPLIVISMWGKYHKEGLDVAPHIHQGFNSYREKATMAVKEDYYWNRKHLHTLGKATMLNANWMLCQNTTTLQWKCT